MNYECLKLLDVHPASMKCDYFVPVIEDGESHKNLPRTGLYFTLNLNGKVYMLCCILYLYIKLCVNYYFFFMVIKHQNTVSQ